MCKAFGFSVCLFAVHLNTEYAATVISYIYNNV